jgi:hypothetical protein
VQRSHNLKLAHLVPWMKWARSHGATLADVGRIFGVSANHAGVLINRANHSGNDGILFPKANGISGGLIDVLGQDGRQVSARAGVRPEHDPLEVLGKPVDLEHRIAAIVEEHKTNGHFLKAAAELKHLKTAVGWPMRIELKLLKADIHRHMAWFYSHEGYSRSAFMEATVAVDLLTDVYKQTKSRAHLKLIGEAALIASNACLLGERPDRALTFLRLAGEVDKGGHGSEYHRQHGVAYFQQGVDRRARIFFDRAPVAMVDKSEAINDAHLLLTGKRQSNLLGTPKFDDAQNILPAVARDFSTDSIQYAMSINWAAACGLSVDDPSENQRALDLLEAHDVVRGFGHQATIAMLLGLTPRVSPSLRRLWVRRALYANAFRNR